MRILLRLAFAVLLVAPALAPAKIYKWIHPDGSVTYSDQPQEKGAKAVELPPLQTYSPPPAPAPADKVAEPATKAGYDVVKVVSPTPDETIRDNGGTVRVQLAVEPALRGDHVVEILLDGKAIGSGAATSVSVSNLDRGSHTISAAIKDSDGKVIATASAVTFHLQRSSKSQPARVPRPPPKPKPP